MLFLKFFFAAKKNPQPRQSHHGVTDLALLAISIYIPYRDVHTSLKFTILIFPILTFILIYALEICGWGKQWIYKLDRGDC
jgi:hypothetical protein